ncbi:MAG: NTP transferase domain-containing protein, partial [Nitrospirae bacterium]|nr:NTP transferase domain-containing protein [Nitrospirota bacterium]
PFTKILPKALIPIGEEPIIDIIIKKFTAYGINNITLSVNHKKEIIKNYFLENKHDIKINWLEEDSFYGTAGSLRLLKGRVTEPFFVTNCDVILDADYRDILNWHIKENKSLTLAASYKQVNIPYGVVGIDNGNLKNIDEKPSFDVLVNCGFYVINPEIIDELPQGVLDMDQLLKYLLEKGMNIGVFPVYSGWFDTGQWEEYRKTIRHFEGMV